MTRDEIYNHLVQDICSKRGVIPAAVLVRGNKNRKAVGARREIAIALYERGYGSSDIARLMNISTSTASHLALKAGE